MVSHADIDVIRCQSVYYRIGARILFELNPDRNTIAVKHRSMDQPERWHGHGSFGCQQTGQVTIDFEFYLGQLVG